MRAATKPLLVIQSELDQASSSPKIIRTLYMYSKTIGRKRAGFIDQPSVFFEKQVHPSVYQVLNIIRWGH